MPMSVSHSCVLAMRRCGGNIGIPYALNGSDQEHAIPAKMVKREYAASGAIPLPGDFSPGDLFSLVSAVCGFDAEHLRNRRDCLGRTPSNEVQTAQVSSS